MGYFDDGLYYLPVFNRSNGSLLNRSNPFELLFPFNDLLVISFIQRHYLQDVKL
jgi:hypothetical protein